MGRRHFLRSPIPTISRPQTHRGLHTNVGTAASVSAKNRNRSSIRAGPRSSNCHVHSHSPSNRIRKFRVSRILQHSGHVLGIEHVVGESSVLGQHPETTIEVVGFKGDITESSGQQILGIDLQPGQRSRHRDSHHRRPLTSYSSSAATRSALEYASNARNCLPSYWPRTTLQALETGPQKRCSGSPPGAAPRRQRRRNASHGRPRAWPAENSPGFSSGRACESARQIPVTARSPRRRHPHRSRARPSSSPFTAAAGSGGRRLRAWWAHSAPAGHRARSTRLR